MTLRGYGERRSKHPPAPLDLARADVCWSLAMGLGGCDLVRGAYFKTLHLGRALALGEPRRLGRLEDQESLC